MGFWNITYGGVTQDMAAWGVSNLQRDRKSAEIGTAKFKLDGKAFDTNPLPFQWKQPLAITRDRKPWFAGWVTKPKPKGAGKAQSIDYEISDVWYWFENTTFQQQWMAVDLTGGAVGTATTTQSEVTLGQSLSGVKMSSGDVIREVLIYMLYSLQGQPFPNTVDVNNLPPLPDPAHGSAAFTIGTIDPDIMVPYAQDRDKKCADIIRQMMKFSPDCVAWVDYSTAPVTVNITRRASMPAKQISVYNRPVKKGFNPTPRYDLQLPAVIVKFLRPYSDGKQSYSQVIVQKYPENILDNAPGVWVQTVDLVGAHTTSQTVSMQVVPRAVAATDAAAMNWILYKESWLKQQLGKGADAPFVWDWANVSCAQLDTVIDPNDPLAKTDPVPDPVKNGFNLDCHTLVNEVITGQVAPWMYDNGGILAAKVKIEVWLAYNGTDAATAKLFTFDPNSPGTKTLPGKGYLVREINTKVTNAATDTYSEVTSQSAGEPVPDGFAQALYESLNQLHFQGDLTIVEQECSDLLPVGYVFNTTDGNPDWQEMDALVLSVSEEIFSGTTTIQFGPPVSLGLDEMEELFRANLGRLPSFKLDQRTTGMYSAGAQVETASHAADTNTISAPTLPAEALPWAPSVKVAADGTWSCQVNPLSLLMKSQAEGDTVNVLGLGSDIPLSKAGDFVYLECPVASGAPSGSATVTSGSVGGTFNPSLQPWDPSGKAYLANDGASLPNQTFFRVLLFKVKPDANGNPAVTPCCVNNLLIFNEQQMFIPDILAYPTSSASIT